MTDKGPQNALPFGPYLLLRRIAVGGMAELYLGSEPRAGRFVVLKRILPHLAQEPEFVKMFLDEARIAGSLHHPNVIDVYELGQNEGSIFITMEWVEGMDLRRVLQREQARGGVVPPGIAAWIVSRLCEGLQYAHTRVGDDGKPLGIIHRDVSPQNIMVSYRGEVKLVDFGIAKATAWISRSKPGVIKGKFLYLAPEQLAEEPLDSRTDLFSLGTMLYELTTGQSPFYRPETEGVIYAIRLEDPPPPHTLRAGYPLSLSRIILKCLVKDRDHRYQTAEEIRVALEDALLVDMPTTRADVINYVAGLFGNDAERTSVYVPPNAQVELPPRGDPPTLAEQNDTGDDDDDEGTASMPAPAALKPGATVVDDDDEDDERTALIETPAPSPPEPTVSMIEKPGPPVPNDVQELSYDSVVSARALVIPTASVTERSKPVDPRRLPSEPSVRVDLDAILQTPVLEHKKPPPERDEPSHPTELQMPAYPPVSAQPLVRPGPPVREESTEPAARARAEKPGPPVDSGQRGPVARAPMADAPVAPAPLLPTRLEMPEAPARQLPPQARRVGPGPTNLNPLDPLDEPSREAKPPRRGKRIVKRRVAGDPDDHIATVDFRDADDELSRSVSNSEEYTRPSSNTWLIAATIVLGAFALVMIIWLLWPATPTQLPDRPRDVVHSDTKPVKPSAATPTPAPRPVPSLVNVQFRAAKSTVIMLDGMAVNPGEIRALPSGPLSLSYRCMPTKRGQKVRDLTLATKVPPGGSGSQPFVIDLLCR